MQENYVLLRGNEWSFFLYKFEKAAIYNYGKELGKDHVMLFAVRRRRIYDAAEHSREIIRWICDDAIKSVKYNRPLKPYDSYNMRSLLPDRRNDKTDQLEVANKYLDIDLEDLKSAMEDNDHFRLLCVILRMEQRLIAIQEQNYERGHVNIITSPEVTYKKFWEDGVSTMLYPLEVGTLDRIIGQKSLGNLGYNFG